MPDQTYPPRTFDCETVIKFGKHVNKTCREIYEAGEAGYLDWMVIKFTNDTFTERFHKMIRGEDVEVEDDFDDFIF